MNPAQAQAVKNAFSDINWDLFEDMDKALNTELWHGPLPDDYWTYADPLEHYKWRNFEQAEKDIREILEPLPAEMYFDVDGGEFATTDNPEDDDDNWGSHCKYCGETLYQESGTWVDDTGGDVCSGNDDLENENEPHVSDDSYFWRGGEWERFNPREALMFKESWKQVF